MCLSTLCMYFSAVKDTLYLYGGIDEEGATSCAQGIFQFDIGMISTRMYSETPLWWPPLGYGHFGCYTEVAVVEGFFIQGLS